MGNAKEIININLDDLRLDEIRDSVLAEAGLAETGPGEREGPLGGEGQADGVEQIPDAAPSGQPEGPLIPDTVVGENILGANPVLTAPVFTPSGISGQVPPANFPQSNPQASSVFPQGTSPEGAAKLQAPAVRDASGYILDESDLVDDDVVFHVRSNVASYWRGVVLEDFDGTEWDYDSALQTMVRSRNSPSFWFDRENADLDIRVRYQHTFFLNDDADTPISSGYQGLQIVAPSIDIDSEEAVLKGDRPTGPSPPFRNIHQEA